MVDIPASEAVVFPVLPPAESDLPWEGRLQRAKNYHNRAWGKLKSAMQWETEAARALSEQAKTLEVAKEADASTKASTVAASMAFEDLSEQLHIAGDEQRGPKE